MQFMSTDVDYNVYILHWDFEGTVGFALIYCCLLQSWAPRKPTYLGRYRDKIYTTDVVVVFWRVIAY